MKNLVILFLLNLLCKMPGFTQNVLPFQNPELKIEERVDDLVSRMTLEEKIAQLGHSTPAIERLGIPEYVWWNESLHGVARAGYATVFPQAIAMAATFDTTLVNRIATAIGREARAKYNLFSKNNQRGIFQGLTFWSPNVNIFRDPRWGRGQETYGEDPFLTSRIGVSYVKGLQGNDANYLMAAGMAKHYAVHNGPEGLRHEFNAVVSKKDLWETYLPAFEALITEAKVEGVMGAYNRTNGIPMNAHPYLMTEVLREKWGFDGYYVSDCGALQDFYKDHKVVETEEQAAALALNEGCNLNCGSVYEKLASSIAQGLTDEVTIDKNLKQLLKTRFRLGMFDPKGSIPFEDMGSEVIRQPSHLDLTLEAAEKSMVLLKNKENLLPLSKEIPSIYVTGPTATHAQALLANYYGLSPNLVTFLEGIVKKAGPATLVHYSQGALLDEKNRNPIDWWSSPAKRHEVTIACIGLSQLIEGEEGESIASYHKGDREAIGLPENQIEFLKKIREKAEKLVVVVTAGSATAIPEIYEIADALIYAWYPGERGGDALGNLLFGDAVPTGRLPVTFVKSIDDLPAYNDYSLDGRTYRYLETAPLFPFGFGLSYTNFKYSNLNLNTAKVKKGKELKATLEVTNTGDIDADEVVQLYLTDLEASNKQPIQSLKGFQKIFLNAGETKKVEFIITPKMMEMVNEEGERIIEKGEFKIYIGGSAYSKVNEELGAARGVESSFIVK